ncbi:Rnase Y domain-containing protein, partial [Micropruina sp.]|uniref:Rnase Y domain-containing protein n=1 Tax=Micropruina sp. TaxID=2737536 RepID=UPI0026147D3C
MDPMQLLAIVAVVLAIVLVGLTLVVVSMVRNQQQAQKQAARRAVEAEKQERSRLQSLVAKVDPLARKAEADEIIATARAEAERVRADAERARLESDAASRLERERVEMLLQEVERRERRVAEREDQHAGLQRKLDERLGDLELTLAELDAQRAALDKAEAEQRKEIARIAGMTPQAAKTELLAQVEHEARLEAVHLSRTIEAEARRDGDQKARQIIVGAIQRLATDQTTESVVTTVPLPSDEMKGRIIGREGRNIRAFEQTTGVNVMIDDTPESVLLSSFDPVRREVARLTLTELVADGRIHPARIEEVYERSKRRIDEICLRAAEDAVAEVGLTDLAPG